MFSSPTHRVGNANKHAANAIAAQYWVTPHLVAPQIGTLKREAQEAIDFFIRQMFGFAESRNIQTQIVIAVSANSCRVTASRSNQSNPPWIALGQAAQSSRPLIRDRKTERCKRRGQRCIRIRGRKSLRSDEPERWSRTAEGTIDRCRFASTVPWSRHRLYGGLR